MANSSSTTPAITTPFEWLSGGLFHFGKGDKRSGKLDITSLIRELDVTLTQIIALEDGDVDGREKVTTAAIDDQEVGGKVAASLSRIRFLLYEERKYSSRDDTLRKGQPTTAGSAIEILTQPQSSDLIPRLLAHLGRLPFECRKDVAAIFNYLLVCGLDGADAPLYRPMMIHFSQYLEQNYDTFMTPILRGHQCDGNSDHPSTPDVALHCGSMFRSTLRHVNLFNELVSSTERVERYVFPFLDSFVHSPNFDVASDATETLRIVLSGGDYRNDEVSQTAMMKLASEFLVRDYEALFEDRFNRKLLSSEKPNYMTRRMALQILSAVLLNRSNYAVMIRYIASKANLILVMNLLRDRSPHITLDAFHVFKIFVANPAKQTEIVKILADNKVKLCLYLETLHKELEINDPQFRDEKALVIATLEGL